MPTVREGTHRGNVCKVLSKDGWMDCYDVADALGWSVDGASKVLGDVYREEYVSRRSSKKKGRENVDYEYQLKSNVSVG
jgi:predicted ArsR family transcriptional regulator